MQTTHIILVSEQAAPAFLPVLDKEIAPVQVILAVTPSMEKRGRARSLEGLFRQERIKVHTHKLPQDNDYVAIEESLLQMALTPTYGLEKGIVYLNLTGGTKLMALAAQNVARTQFAEQWRPFYVDLATGRLLWLGNQAWPEGAVPPARALDSSVRLHSYLAGYGYEVVRKRKPTALSRLRRDLIADLITGIDSKPKLAFALGHLNALAEQSERENQLDVALQDKSLSHPSFRWLLDSFQSAGCLRYNDETLAFESDEERSFVKGGWLEDHVYEIVSSLYDELKLKDHAQNLEVRDISARTANEIDVCFLQKNRLFVIECKTARMDTNQRANDTLYRLVNIHSRVGGVGARGMLVTYREVGEGEQQLAASLGVRIVQSRGIAHLRAALSDWVGGR